ncbi:MAG: 16S rRNA (guanine(527)-N(7))-methyltransferase RsmG [Desulfuromonadales bacterium]
MIRNLLENSTREMGLNLSDKNFKSFEMFAAELIKWNRRINLTAINCDNEIAIKHIIDSLHLAPYVFDEDQMLDIGSGAGLPIIPLKIIKPETTMLSVDAVAKKVNFQRHVIRVLELQSIEALHVRAEDLHEMCANKFSIITSRSLARLDFFASLAAPLLAQGGRMIAMKGADAEDEIAASSDTLRKLGLIVTALHRYSLPLNMGNRCLAELKARESA